MRIDPATALDNLPPGAAPVLRTEARPRLASPSSPAASTENQAASPPAVTDGGLSLRRLIGDVDIRRLSPRQMAETSLDLYVAGILPWEEYAMLAFQAELHPDYDKTIGVLTGEKAEPDRPRDFLSLWEERLAFEEKYNAERPKLVERTRHIVQTFRQISQPTNLMA